MTYILDDFAMFGALQAQSLAEMDRAGMMPVFVDLTGLLLTSGTVYYEPFAHSL